jgi:uncharacterized protein YndB with AHSA1/START domain
MTTTPNVPLRGELTFTLPASAERVWEAIATAQGISSWFLPTETIETRDGVVGSVLRMHMGEGSFSDATITGWDAPRRLVYSEPGWASLTGHDDAAVTPMVTEFLVEAQSGGTCVLRVVTSAFGTGAEWEREFFDHMMDSWAPYFDNLRLFLTHFPGQHATSLSVAAVVPGEVNKVYDALVGALGANAAGKPLDARGLSGVVERVAEPDGPQGVLVRTTEPIPSMLGFLVHDKGDGLAEVWLEGYLFGAGAREAVDRERSEWKTWIESLAVSA